MRVVFMGTPDFAVASLEVLQERSDEVVLVISQQDKPRGRGKKMEETPVKRKALEFGYAVYQPKRIKDMEAIEKIKSLCPDVIVVTAYGQVLPKEILEIPTHGCINVHASLLPRHRGAAPIQYALLCGDKKTGITTMMMDEGLDTGDMLLKEEVEITKQDSLETLSQKLKVAGKKALHDTLRQLEKSGNIERQQQDDTIATYAAMLTRETGYICWNKKAEEISNLIRAVEGWPSAITFYQGEKIKLFQAEQTGEDCTDFAAGMIAEIGKEYLKVATGDEFVKLYEVQFPGKKRMKVADYLRGNAMEEGVVFGTYQEKEEWK